MRYLLLIAVLAGACGKGEGGPEDVDAAPPRPIDAARPDAPPPIDAPSGTLCAVKDPIIQLGFTCHIVWSQCSDQINYDLSCMIQNVGGQVFSLCTCTQNGGQAIQFGSGTVCSSTTFAEVEAVVNEKCGWDLR